MFSFKSLCKSISPWLTDWKTKTEKCVCLLFKGYSLKYQMKRKHVCRSEVTIFRHTKYKILETQEMRPGLIFNSVKCRLHPNLLNPLKQFQSKSHSLLEEKLAERSESKEISLYSLQLFTLLEG